MNTTGTKSEEARRLSALRVCDAKRWRDEIVRAMNQAELHVKDFQGSPGAASILGVAAPTLFEWLRTDLILANLLPRPGSESGRPPKPEAAKTTAKPAVKKGSRKKRRG